MHYFTAARLLILLAFPAAAAAQEQSKFENQELTESDRPQLDDANIVVSGGTLPRRGWPFAPLPLCPLAPHPHLFLPLRALQAAPSAARRSSR